MSRAITYLGILPSHLSRQTSSHRTAALGLDHDDKMIDIPCDLQTVTTIDPHELQII
jgi:hypothetical protein